MRDIHLTDADTFLKDGSKELGSSTFHNSLCKTVSVSVTAGVILNASQETEVLQLL